MMIAAARHFCDGGAAIGTAEPRVPHVELASFEGVVPKSTDWRTLDVQAQQTSAAA